MIIAMKVILIMIVILIMVLRIMTPIVTGALEVLSKRLEIEKHLNNIYKNKKNSNCIINSTEYHLKKL